MLSSNCKKSSFFFIDFTMMEKVRTKLVNIISNFKEKAEFMKFISTFSLYLEEPFEKRYKSFFIPNLNFLSKEYIKISNILKDIPKKYENRAGVYIIKDDNGSYFYIGSSINIHNRIKNHLLNFRKPNRGGNSLFYKHVKSIGGWNCFSIKIIKEIPNCLHLFLKEYPYYKLTKNEMLVLNFLTIFIVRSYELMFINIYKPNLNQYVVFPFLNFNIQSLSKNNFKYKGYSRNNILLVESFSMSHFSLNLGLSKTTIYRYLNSNKYVFSKKLGLYLYINRGENKNNLKSLKNNLWINREYPDISNVDLNKLPKGLIALDIDKKTILAQFNSIKETALFLDNKKEVRYISRYINKEKIIKTGGLNCYFVRNSNKKIAFKHSPNKKSIILFDIIDKYIIYFDSIKELLIYLGHKTGNDTSMIKRNIINNILNKPYKKRYLFLYKKDLLENDIYKILSLYLNMSITNENVPILSWDICNNTLILYKDVKEMKLVFYKNIDVSLYFYLSQNKYENRYQFIYLVDYYCNNIYKDFLNVDVKNFI